MSKRYILTLTSKSVTFKLIACCVKAIHAVNAALWQPGEQTQNCRQTDRPTDYYITGSRGWA